MESTTSKNVWNFIMVRGGTIDAAVTGGEYSCFMVQMPDVLPESIT